MTPLLELSKVQVKGQRNIRLEDISLTIESGDKIALLGESGAGKSTLISVANGTIIPNNGDVMLSGLSLRSLTNRQQMRIATLWQDLRLIEELRVIQNINAGALGRHNLWWSIANLIGSINYDSCLRCLEASGLNKEVISSRVSELSGGQRQRVAIARVLNQKADLLLADEPLSNLDPSLANEILNLFLSNKASEVHIPNTVMISLHRPDLINNFTRVVGLKDGRLILDQSTKDIDQSSISWLYH